MISTYRNALGAKGTNCKSTFSQFRDYLMVVLMSSMFGTVVSAQLVTWIKPSGDTESGLQLSSVAKNASFDIYDAKTGAPVESTTELGWKYEDYELGAALRAGQGTGSDGKRYGDVRVWGLGKETKIRVSNLPPGKHEVSIRYWATAPGPDQMWYMMKASLGDEKTKWHDHSDGRVVNGLGGYEPTIYEKRLGVVGEETEDATQVDVRFERMRHSFVARFCGIRIESQLNAEIPQTSGAALSAEEQDVRQQLLDNSARISKDLSYGLGAVPSTLKIRPKTFGGLVGVPIRDRFELSGAHGEWVSSQLVVFSPDRDLQIESLDVQPLIHTKTGRKIEIEDVLFAPVGFLFLDKSFDLDVHGWWPEPILTFLNKDFTIAKGDVQPLWLRVHIPRSLPAGLYEGSVTVVPKNGSEATVPIHLEVHDFKMPKQFTFPFITSAPFLTSSRHTRVKGGEEFLLSYGIAPSSIYSSTTPTKEDLTRWAKDGRVNAFNVLYGNPDYMIEELDVRLEQMARCLEQAESLGIRDKAYFYMYDERKMEDLPEMREVSQAVHERFPDLLQLTTSHIFGGHGAHDKLPYLKGWVPGALGYKYDEAMRARREYDREVWWYTCNTPRPPSPTLFTSQPAMAHRLFLGFMPYAYKTDGFLYWRVEKYWPQEEVDISNGPYVRNGWPVREYGQIVQRGVNGPLPSLRLGAVRDGLQDYEYLRMAQERMELLKEVGKDKWPENLRGLSEEVTPYFNLGNSLVQSYGDFSRDPRELEKVRRKLARFITAADVFLHLE